MTSKTSKRLKVIRDYIEAVVMLYALKRIMKATGDWPREGEEC